MEFLLLYVLIAILLSFLCSILEAVILSISPNYLESIKNSRPEEYRDLAPLKKNIERPLASILTINTFAHTIGAAGAGAEAQKVFGNEWITLFSILLTLAILFLSEIIPKSIGATYWKSLSHFAAKVLPPMIAITYPLVFLSEKISSLFNSKGQEKISRDEIQAIVDMGFKDGALETSEYNLLKKLMAFKHVTAHAVMTKADQVTTINSNFCQKEISQTIIQNGHSRIPVLGVHEDDIKGYILKNDILSDLALDKELEMQKYLHPMLIVPTYIRLKTLFFRLLERREHICAVVDDYGTFVGIVTLEDIIEALLGLDIIDELDT